jgi:hypothetical protein
VRGLDGVGAVVGQVRHDVWLLEKERDGTSVCACVCVCVLRAHSSQPETVIQT